MLNAAVLDTIYIIAKACAPVKRNAVDFARSIGLEPDPWQYDFLESGKRRRQINCSRQSGKTTITGTLAAHQALAEDESQTVILAPGKRQGSILMRKAKWAMRRAGWSVKPRINNEFEMILENDSSILVLPGSEETSRGPSGIDLMLVEEASRVEDELYHAVRPVMATRPNALEIQLSTPFGTRGFFYEQWKRIKAHQAPEWDYFEVPAEQCPRITPEFLAEERRIKGFWWFEQEYHNAFLDAQSSAFRSVDIERMVDTEMEAWSLSLSQ